MGWVEMLDDLKNKLRTCSQESTHKFFGGLASCPWCVLERQSGVLFFIGKITTQAGQTPFNIALVWQRIESVSSPGEAPSIDPSQFAATPKPFPKEIQTARKKAIIKKTSAVVIVIGTLAVYSTYPGAFLVGLIIAIILLFFSGVDDSRERTIRKMDLTRAQSNWNDANHRWRREAGDSMFKEKLKELKQLKSQYESIDTEFVKEKQNLHATIRERQLNKFLDGFFISDHKIPQIGPARKATLASFGIETAADIKRSKIQGIPRFGDALTRELEQWRKSLESKFVFDSAKGIDPVDIDALNQKFRQRKSQIESTLLAGPEVLNQIKADIISKRQLLLLEVKTAAQSLSQARSDMSVFEKWI